MNKSCLILLLIFGGLGSLIFISTCQPITCDQVFPSGADAAAVAFFNDHRGEFERLRELLEGNRELVYTNWAHTPPSSPTEAWQGSPEKEAEVRGLMKKLKLQAVNGPASDWGMRLGFLSDGFAMGGSDKSFWFGEALPPKAKLVASTDHLAPLWPGSGSALRQIEGSWYLRFDWGG